MPHCIYRGYRALADLNYEVNVALSTGHYKTKRREGTRNCFYCNHDVTEWLQLTWPQIKAIYEHCGVKTPTALCCKECHKNKPNEELYRMFWATLLALECKAYKDGKPTIIKDKDIYNLFISQMKEHKKYLTLPKDAGL